MQGENKLRCPAYLLQPDRKLLSTHETMLLLLTSYSCISFGTPEKFHSKIVLHHSGKIKSKCGNRIAPQLLDSGMLSPLLARISCKKRHRPSCSNTGSFRVFFSHSSSIRRRFRFISLICLISQRPRSPEC